jgi:hypothetical protein
MTDPRFSDIPTGFRDLYWCWHLNEPVIIEYRDKQSYCTNCHADLLGDSEEHTFIAHVYKPDVARREEVAPPAPEPSHDHGPRFSGPPDGASCSKEKHALLVSRGKVGECPCCHWPIEESK